MPKLDRIYTKTGDEGTTGSAAGSASPRTARRVVTYGTVDELQLAARRRPRDRPVRAPDTRAPDHPERALRPRFGPVLAVRRPAPGAHPHGRGAPRREARTPHRRVQRRSSGPLTNFLLPGGALGAAHLHVARTICRRAEREAVRLGRDEAIGEHVLPYLNRLSDALFVMARYENHERGVPEPLWQPGR